MEICYIYIPASKTFHGPVLYGNDFGFERLGSFTFWLFWILYWTTGCRFRWGLFFSAWGNTEAIFMGLRLESYPSHQEQSLLETKSTLQVLRMNVVWWRCMKNGFSSQVNLLRAVNCPKYLLQSGSLSPAIVKLRLTPLGHVISLLYSSEWSHSIGSASEKYFQYTLFPF